MSTHGIQGSIRQTLIGNVYQLINSTTLRPNPSYWIALLWRRLIGTRSIDYSLSTSLPKALHVSLHCSKTDGEVSNPIAVIINFHMKETHMATECRLFSNGGRRSLTQLYHQTASTIASSRRNAYSKKIYAPLRMCKEKRTNQSIRKLKKKRA